METWRINVRSQKLLRQTAPDHWEKLGGRGLIARILLDEVPATCDPLGPFNKLIFAPGLLVGHMLSSCDRLSVGCKSPLTGGIKEANAGGSTALQIVSLGIKALILEDQPTTSDWWIIKICADGVVFESANSLAGLGVYETAEKLLDRYGDHNAISLIGPGGEMQLLVSGIMNLDKDRTPSRINARGGVGAVMGSKKIKAIVFDASAGRKAPIIDPEAYKTAHNIFNQALLEHPQTAIYRDYGTSAMTKMANSMGTLPTRNFSNGQFEKAEMISGEFLRQTLIDRGSPSNPTHSCMAGCVIRCSNVIADVNGKIEVAPLDYETIGLVGSNLGIADLDTIARINWTLNDIGLDSIDIGAALGVACDAGLMKFGDGQRAEEILQEIRNNTPLGRIIGNGAALTGKVLGVRRVPVVKNQAMSAYDPRSVKGTGVTYATSPMGADHTAGQTIRAKIDHLDPKVQAQTSRGAQINSAGYDNLGVCSFATFGFAVVPEAIRDLINARYGWNIGTDFLQVLGRETLSLEREFNKRAGFSPADDRIPEWMTQEPLPPIGSVFDVSNEDLDGIFNW